MSASQQHGLCCSTLFLPRRVVTEVSVRSFGEEPSGVCDGASICCAGLRSAASWCPSVSRARQEEPTGHRGSYSVLTCSRARLIKGIIAECNALGDSAQCAAFEREHSFCETIQHLLRLCSTERLNTAVFN